VATIDRLAGRHKSHPIVLTNRAGPIIRVGHVGVRASVASGRAKLGAALKCASIYDFCHPYPFTSGLHSYAGLN
jgi:hypothetical protein